MNRVVKTTIASALVLSMALGGTTAAMAAAPAEEENCISAASIANWAENTRIKLFNKSVYAKYNPGVTVEKDENSPTGYTVTFILQRAEELYFQGWSDDQYDGKSADQGGAVQ